MNLEDGNKKVAVHVYGDEKIRLWKRWGDGYNTLYDIKGKRSSIYMEVRFSIQLQLHKVNILEANITYW